MERRVQMLLDWETGAFSVTELSRRYGVSRDTVYLWTLRRQGGTLDWFVDRSHAPLSRPHRMDDALVEPILAMKRRFPHFGPKKVKARLEVEQPRVTWPAASTIGAYLKAAGLVEPKTRRRRAIDQGRTSCLAQGPNAEWACDFKGWFRTRDGTRCDPLTLTDTYSRYLLATTITAQTIEGVRPVFERVFREHGLPLAIRSDNGAPFGSSAAGGLTRLSAWWIRRRATPRHPARLAAGERPPRAHAPDLEGADRRSAFGQPGRAAGPLRHLPPPLQR